MTQPPRILYCHCAYAQVVPKEVKQDVLRKLCDSRVAFDAVADLCEMAARRDPALAKLAGTGELKIAACFPRAVKWLFAGAQARLATNSTEVLNMRTQPAEEIVKALLSPALKPNLPVKESGPLSDISQATPSPSTAALSPDSASNGVSQAPIPL
jgi:hypothetical protein